MPFILDLLPLSDGQADHYVLIKKLKILVSNLKQQVPRSSNKICRNRFHVCYTAKKYEKHIETCMQNEAATVKLPDQTKNDLQIQNYQPRWFAPNVKYFEFESVFKPVATCSNTSDRRSSVTIERHEPCGFCLVVIEHNKPEPVSFKLERSSKCRQRVVENLQKPAKDIYERKKQLHRKYAALPQFPSNQCWMCEKDLAGSEIVLDHCDASGKLLASAHSKCNLQQRTVNYIPIFAHNLSNYDLYFICKNLQLFPENSKI